MLGVWGPTGTRVVAAEAMWREPLKWDAAARAAGERHRVFCASLADVFEGPETMPAEAVPVVDAARARLLSLIQDTPHLDWLLLTKRPQNFARSLRAALDTGKLRISETKRGPKHWNVVDWLHERNFPPNVWVGTSVEDQAAADERIPHLLKVPAAVRFLSCEPLIGPVDLLRTVGRGGLGNEIPLIGCRACGGTGYHQVDPFTVCCPRCRRSVFADRGAGVGVHWVIVGGESGGGARPFDPAWARAIRDQCRAAGVAVFVKQVGSAPVGLTVRGKGGEPTDIPADLMVREFPTPRRAEPASGPRAR